jgi:PRTRC genetic system protein B
VLSTRSRAVAALVVYTHDPEDSDAFSLECREIGGDGLMGAGKPVTCDFMNAIAGAFSERFSRTPYGPVPRNMLYADTRQGRERYVWYVPPGEHTMYFASSLNIDNGEYCLPGLVFSLVKNDLHVLAWRGRSVTRKTRLCSAPFFNVNASTGKICLGSGRKRMPPDLTYENMIAHWEDLFWRTEFTHVLGGNPTRSDLAQVLKGSGERFDDRELKPIHDLTIQKLLKP